MVLDLQRYLLNNKSLGYDRVWYPDYTLYYLMATYACIWVKVSLEVRLVDGIQYLSLTKWYSLGAEMDIGIEIVHI